MGPFCSLIVSGIASINALADCCRQISEFLSSIWKSGGFLIVLNLNCACFMANPDLHTLRNCLLWMIHYLLTLSQA